MTDEEKFQKTFDKLHASPDVLTEVLKMTAKEQVVPMKKKRFTPKVIIPELSEPPVRTLGATIPENESHIFR